MKEGNFHILHLTNRILDIMAFLHPFLMVGVKEEIFYIIHFTNRILHSMTFFTPIFVGGGGGVKKEIFIYFISQTEY